jgi:hypothetical protein
VQAPAGMSEEGMSAGGRIRRPIKTARNSDVHEHLFRVAQASGYAAWRDFFDALQLFRRKRNVHGRSILLQNRCASSYREWVYFLLSLDAG